MTEIKYGLFSAFILIIWLIIQYTLLVPGYHEISYYMSFIVALIPAIGIFLGIKERKNIVNFGYISFKEAFKTGMIITLIIAAVVVIFIYVYYEYINPAFLNYLAAETERLMLQNNTGRDEINASITVIQYRYSLTIQLIMHLIFILLGGTAISFTASLLMKKMKRHRSE